MTLQEIEEALKNITHQSMFADCIRLDPSGAMQMIKDQIKDNRPVMCAIIGENLVVEIEKLAYYDEVKKILSGLSAVPNSPFGKIKTNF